MVSECETWLIETGDIVTAKKARLGLSSLSDTERAIYCFWVIDYSVRNSGTLSELEALYPESLSDLNQFARDNHCAPLFQISSQKNETNGEYFFEKYYRLFDLACAEIRMLYEHT